MSDRERKEPTATGTVDLVGHSVLGDATLVQLADVTNVIIKATSEQSRWIEEFTSQIGPARARLRSTYLHWALAINALCIAAERYASKDWRGQFIVTGLRRHIGQATLASWSGDEASEAHRATIPKMAVWGYIEMYSALESSIFEFYRSYWTLRPDLLIQGSDFKTLRSLKRAAESGDNEAVGEWKQAWSDRLDSWCKKRAYDGLHDVFRAFCTHTGLKTPSIYQSSTVETWAETIQGLGMLRHLLSHGQQIVNSELDAFCAKPHSMAFKFRLGEPLRVDLFHLQAFELFTDQLLTALNISAMEHPDARH